MKLDEAIKKRRSIRDFSHKKVKWADLLEAIDAALQAPFAGNINNLKFLIISEQETKNEIAKQAEQNWISNAPYLIMVCSNEAKLEKLYDTRASTYSKQQAGAAIQNILLKLTDLKIGSCWVGSYQDEIIKQILKIPENIKVEAIIPVGYPSGKIKSVEKQKLENVLNWEKWDQTRKPTIFDEPKTS